MILCVNSPFTVPRKQLGIVSSQISLQAPTYPLTMVILQDELVTLSQVL